jgi:hypothetical protein
MDILPPMSKTNDTPNFSHGTKDHGILADSELDAVTGGTLIPTAVEVGDIKCTVGSQDYRQRQPLK